MNKLLLTSAIICTMFMSSCDKNEILSHTTPEKVLKIANISSEDLNGWDKGVLINENIYLCESQDSLTNVIYGIIGSLSDTNNLSVVFSDNHISQIITEVETFDFIYDKTSERVVLIKTDGSIVELKTKVESHAGKAATTRDESNEGWFDAVQDFLDSYADQLETSDSRFIRDFADNLRDLPYNLLEDGVTELVTKLTGLDKLPYVKDILKWLQDNQREQILFGGCSIAITDTSESTEPFTIRAAVTDFCNLPELGDAFQSLSAGIVGRNTGIQSDSWNLPTVTYKEYKWEQVLMGDGTITGSIPQMKLGWYTFRPFISRGGVTTYGTPYFYYCPTLDETPTYTISNIKCEYVGNDKFDVQFTCTLEPLKNNNLEFQGIELTLKDGSKLTSFGSGRYTEKVNKTVSASNFSVSGLKTTLKINAKYWYVPMLQSKTYYKDLESKEFCFTLSGCPDENHPHWIDLGLPSGTQWSCCNAGATKPEEYGTYYSFINTTDAPSREQIEELINSKYTSCSYTSRNGVFGSLFKSRNGNGGEIFLPAAGWYHPAHESKSASWIPREQEPEWYDRVGTAGFYWSSTKDTNNHDGIIYGYYLFFEQDYNWKCNSTSVGCWDAWTGQHYCAQFSLRQVR